MSFKQKEISLSGSTIEILTINPVSPNAPECYALQAIKSVIPTFQENVGINGINTDKGTYPFKDRKTITITFHDETSNPSIKFDLEEISNQPGWTLNLAGVIQAVTDICGWITTATGPTTGLATEATALNILNAIVASGQDIEVLLVRDTGDSDKVLQQITDYINNTTVYKDVNGNIVVPVGPLEYLDPSAVLNLMLTQLQVLNAGGQLLTEATFTAEDFATESTLGVVNTNLSTINTNVQLGNVVLGNLLTAFNAEDFATEATLNTVLTTLATEATLLDVETAIDTVKLDTANLDVALSTRASEVTLAAVNTKLTSVVRTPSLQRISGVAAASIAAGARSASFFNAGLTDATVAGGTLKPGESISFDAGGQGDTLGAIPYVTIATGDLVITTIT